MSTALWMNIPLMVLAFGLMAGIPLWLVLRRHDWHGKHETPSVPAYMTSALTRHPVPVEVAMVRDLTRRPVAVEVAMVRLPRSYGHEGRRSMRPVTDGANG